MNKDNYFPLRVKPKGDYFRLIALSLIWIWLIVFAVIPTGLVLFTSLLQQGDHELVRLQLTLDNYSALFNTIYFKIFIQSLLLAGSCSLICLIIGYPFAYILARAKPRYKGILLLFVIIPFWTSSLVRTYAIVAILKTKGILNTLLLNIGLIHKPLHLLYSSSAVMIGLVYSLLPFMILPLYANIEKLDTRLIDAARDLGANKYRVFVKIIIPLTLPGIIAGCMLVFLPAMSMFYIPDILGGAKSILIGNLIQNQFLTARNWPLGSAVSIGLTLMMGLLLLLYWRSTKQNKNGQNLL
ncbi:MAG: Spermidine/putrescine transport system permease protein PotB [Legionellaceae bacterium]